MQFNPFSTITITTILLPMTLTMLSIQTRNLFYIFTLSLLLLFVSDPVFALNVEKIGKGVAGNDREKMKMLKDIVFYTGVFFNVLGAIVTAFTKNKFALQKRSDTNNAVGPFLLIFGLLLMLIKLF